MAKGSRSSRALALVLAQALWVLPGERPASAQQVTLPPDFISPDVPHDVTSGSGATPQELALFAWQEFIALNWTAVVPTSVPGGVRGRPDTSVGFLDITPDSTGNFPLVVWQTYRHKNELFPFGGPTDPVFDSPVPTYKYKSQPTPATNGPIPSFNLFNNLDETSQIGLANMYAYAKSDVEPPSTPMVMDPTTGSTTAATPGTATGFRVAYEAKVNRAVFDYLVDPVKGYTKVVPVTVNGAVQYTYPMLSAALNNTVPVNNGGLYAGICSPVDSTPIVMLPCGDNAVPGDSGEGAIEIKAAWRQLTSDEISKGRFFKRNVLFYTGPQGNQRYNNGVWGLVALHIIHKTKSFPAFVFATWEQVDNYDDDAAAPNSQNIAFQNLPLKDSATTSIVNIPVTRAHAIPQYIQDINDAVHTAFKDPTTGNPDTVWQYYKLVGVQATPVSGPPPAGATPDELSYYFLANIMVETNQTLQNFFGDVGDDGLPEALNQVYVKGATGSPFAMGGCQGCHGFQGQFQGGDMSVLIAGNGPNAQQAESIDSLEAASTRTVIHRDRGLALGDGHSLREFELSRTRVPSARKGH